MPTQTQSSCTRVPILIDFKIYFCIISLNIYAFVMIYNWISQKSVQEPQAVGDPPLPWLNATTTITV